MSTVMDLVGRTGRVALMASCLAFTLAACGSSSGDGGGLTPPAPPPPPPPPPPPEAAEAGGIWFGTFQLDGEAGQPAEGIVAEDGRFHFNVNDGEGQFYGQLSISGDTASGDFTAVVILEGDDEEVTGAGTLELEVTSRSSLEGTFTLDLGDVGQGEGNVVLEYDALYEREASLSEIAGTYQDTDDPTDVFTITASGVFDQMDPESNCVANGQFTIVDPEFNAYVLEADIANCEGEVAVLNGNVLNGLFYFDDTGSPVLLVGGIHIELTVEGEDFILAVWSTSERP